MKEIGLPCKPWEIKAFLDGRKTAVVRPVKFPFKTDSEVVYSFGEEDKTPYCQYGPLGTIGDLIFMKETWVPDCNETIYYHDVLVEGDIGDFKWKPSTIMPKSAARIWMEITDVRVKRVRELSEEEILSIGVRDRENFRHLWQTDYGTWDQNPYVWIYDLKRVER